ncbi:MAG: lipid-binding protein [Sphingobacteriales bacterium 50-39]|nr:YceI family protein [Sphingobacteriales bacterium]OJW59598.1 MAG: lipid-binding protein [Sphingobacteriales bacterium 50-39]
MSTKIFKIDTAKSTIEWVGKKVTGAHNGTIDIADGALTLADDKLTGGNFTIDTASIRILDVTDPATNAQFAGHLASDDFFATEQYPTVVFEITSVRDNHVEGNLTIKGITRPVAFDASLHLAGNTLTASGKIIVDRTKYGIKFRSGNFFKDLGDTLIYDNFVLNVQLTAAPQAFADAVIEAAGS